MSTAIQKYATWTEEDLADTKQATEKKGKFLKLKTDKNQLRFLPAKLGNKPIVVTYSHFVELRPGDENSKVSFNCPKKMARRRCPVCDKSESLMNTGSKQDRDRAFELAPKCRVYAAVINRADEDAGAQIYAFGKKILEGLQVLREDRGDFCDPGEDGFDVIIRKAGSGRNGTTYSVSAAKHNSPMLEDASVMDDTIDMLPALSTFAYVPTPDEVKVAMDDALAGRVGGNGGNGGGRSEREERPRSQTRKVETEYIDTDATDVAPTEDWD